MVAEAHVSLMKQEEGQARPPAQQGGWGMAQYLLVGALVSLALLIGYMSVQGSDVMRSVPISLPSFTGNGAQEESLASLNATLLLVAEQVKANARLLEEGKAAASGLQSLKERVEANARLLEEGKQAAEGWQSVKESLAGLESVKQGLAGMEKLEEKLAELMSVPLAQKEEEVQRCDFDYEGPLRPVDLNCYIEYFPFATPLEMPERLGGIPGTDDDPAVPIFILFKDRISVAIETFRALHRNIKTPFEIVVFDDNSTFPAAANFVKRLAASGVTVIEHGETEWRRLFREHNAFDYFFLSAKEHFDKYMETSKSDVLVITDADCALDSSPPNILEIYKDALSREFQITKHLNESTKEKTTVTSKLHSVGASLRWDDWPEGLPPFEMGFSRKEARSFRYPDSEKDGRNYYYLQVPVDTTFAMYRKGNIARVGWPSIRMLPPLGVRHLDFYLQKENLPEDYTYYQLQVGGHNHMGHLRPKEEKPGRRRRRQLREPASARR